MWSRAGLGPGDYLQIQPRLTVARKGPNLPISHIAYDGADIQKVARHSVSHTTENQAAQSNK